jgi:hypothetical protein
VSGPHDFAVRKMRPRLGTTSRPPHPAPYVRDDRERPFWVGGDIKAYTPDFDF